MKKGFTLEKNKRKSPERQKKNPGKSPCCLPLQKIQIGAECQDTRKDIFWGESGPDRLSGVFGLIEKVFRQFAD